jgi:hypothetical protein
MAALFGASGSENPQDLLSWMAVVFVSVLFHELGHALVGRLFGCDAAIELYGMGGVTHLVRKRPVALTWYADLLISLAGPVFGLALGLGVFLAGRRFPALHENPALVKVVRDLLWTNIGWSVLNLAPIVPYDGGLALRALLMRVSPTRGLRWSHVSTVIVGGLAIAGAVYIRSIWLGYLAARGVIGSFQALRFDFALDGAWKRWDDGAYTDARAAGVQAIGAAGGSVVHQALATELVILASLAGMDADAAKRAFDTYPRGVVPSALLRAVVALDGEDRAAAATLLKSVPAPILARVFVPLVVTWSGDHDSAWQDRAALWLDATTVEALPPELTRILADRLERRGSVALAQQVLGFVTGQAPRPAEATA